MLRVWLIMGIPKQLINGPHDDLYYAKMADYLINGQWMGPYNQMTLIKGPFYGFFLVFSFLTGLPLFLNENLFYILACIAIFFAVSPLIKNLWWRYLLFVIMLFIPASLTTGFNLRVYREFVYFSLTLFVVAFALGLFLRLNKNCGSIIFWSIGLGLSMGAFLLTREEGSWIYPLVGLLLIVSIVIVWKRPDREKFNRTFLIILPVLIWIIPTVIVSFMNYKQYRFWGVSEQLDRDFNRVINTLGRIKTDSWYPYSPITDESLVKAAQASPKFAELLPSLLASSDAWQPYIDTYMVQQSAWFYEKYYIKEAALGSHFIWMFRNVLASQGYYDNGFYPREQLAALADDLTKACDTKALDCKSLVNIPIITSLKLEHIPIIWKFFIENTKYLFQLHSDITGFPSLDLKTWPSYVEDFKFFDQFIYNPIESRMQGNPGSDLWIGENMDVRFKTIQVKEIALQNILKIYQFVTLPMMIVICLGWCIFLIFCLANKIKNFSFTNLAVFVFLAGLLMMRVMLLSIFNATSSIIGRYYGASCYVFLYLLIFISAYLLISKFRSIATVKNLN